MKDNSINTLAVFAARYAHNRNTAAAFAVLNSLKGVVDQLPDNIKKQIYDESYEAISNQDDWENIRALLKEDK